MHPIFRMKNTTTWAQRLSKKNNNSTRTRILKLQKRQIDHKFQGINHYFWLMSS